MLSAKKIVSELLAQADVQVNGDRPWDILVHDERLYGRILHDKSLGLGEAYMDGWWDCQKIDVLIERLMRAQLDCKVRSSLRCLLSLLPMRLMNMQSRTGAKHVAKQHYNLDNELFLSFLDSYNQYSCGMFSNGCSLEQAQRNKLELTCRKLDLKPEDRLLDIGCGWGGLAKYAAETVGCQVTGINIAREQINHARNECKGLPVDILECDYRDVPDMGVVFDKIVSVGMFEHVGRRNYREFMGTVHRLLPDCGIFLLHTIGSNHTGTNTDPWMEKYIFPRGMLPSIAQIAKAAEDLFVMEDWHNLGSNYARTLHAWRRRFEDAWPRLAQKHGERVRRMIEYYLFSCAGAFQARAIQVWQIVFTKTGRDQPECGRAGLES